MNLPLVIGYLVKIPDAAAGQSRASVKRPSALAAGRRPSTSPSRHRPDSPSTAEPTHCTPRSAVLSTRRVNTMPNRRDFVKTLAGASAAMLAARANAVRPERAREVSVGGRRVKVVDVHGHFIEPSELDVVSDTNLAGNISNNLNGRARARSGSASRALDEWGIDVQVLSHQGGWWYGADRDLARRIVTDSEREAGGVVRGPSGSLRRPGVRRAAASRSRGRAARGSRQASWGCAASASPAMSPARCPSSPKFDPFWAKAEAARRARVRAPRRRRQRRQGGRAARTRRSRQHHRQPARDDGLSSRG